MLPALCSLKTRLRQEEESEASLKTFQECEG